MIEPCNGKRTIAVIGAGFAGYRFIAESVRLTELQGLNDSVRYVVIDKRPIEQYGRGVAWTGTQSEALRANMNSATIVLGTGQNDALLSSIETINADSDPISTLYQSRKEIGDRIHTDFLRVLKDVAELEIELHSIESRLASIDRKGIGYTVATIDGGELFADIVVLATGHFPSSNYPDLRDCDGYIETAWDWERLGSIPVGKRIGLLGMGPTAVDAALVLNENGHSRLKAVSRSGLMQYPRPRHTTAKLQFVNEHLLYGLAEPFGGLSVDMLISLAAAEVSCHPGALEKLKDAYRESLTSPALSLRQGYAKCNDAEDWFGLLIDLEKFVPLAWRLLHDNERQRFASLYRSISNLAYGMAPPQALRVMDMIDEGRFETRGGLESVTWAIERSCFLAKFGTTSTQEGEEEEYDVIIDCTGLGRDLSSAPWLFIKPMVENGLLYPSDRGGAHVDFKSGQVTNDEGRAIAEIYCLAGSLTIGAHFVTNGLSKVARTAHQTAVHIHKKLDGQTATALAWEDVKRTVDREVGEVA